MTDNDSEEITADRDALINALHFLTREAEGDAQEAVPRALRASSQLLSAQRCAAFERQHAVERAARRGSGFLTSMKENSPVFAQNFWTPRLFLGYFSSLSRIGGIFVLCWCH